MFIACTARLACKPNSYLGLTMNETVRFEACGDFFNELANWYIFAKNMILANFAINIRLTRRSVPQLLRLLLRCW